MKNPKEIIHWAEDVDARNAAFKDMRECFPNWEYFFHVTCQHHDGTILSFKSCVSLNAAMKLWASTNQTQSTVIAVGSCGI